MRLSPPADAPQAGTFSKRLFANAFFYRVNIMTEQWIMYAGIAVWIGIGLYAAFIAVKQAALTKKIETLELLEDRESGR